MSRATDRKQPSKPGAALGPIAVATNAEVPKVGEEVPRYGSFPRPPHGGVPQSVLRDALKNVVVAVQASANGARDSEIEQAAQTIEAAFTQIVDERLAARAAPQEVRFVLPENYVPGYQAAVEAGAQARTTIFKRADMLSSQDIGDKLGVSRETVNQRRHARQLLALQHEARGFRYPAWQIEPGVRDAIAGVLAELGEDTDPWAAYLFFTQSNPLLGGNTPLEALKEGATANVLRAAAGMREELA